MVMKPKRLWTVAVMVGQWLALLAWPKGDTAAWASSFPDSCSLRVSWDANPEPDVAGYRVYYGTCPHEYLQALDVGNVTSVEVSGLTAGMRYYFAVTAYDSSGNESLFSSEVSGEAGLDWGTVVDLQPEEYVVAALREGSQYYVDRSFQIVDIPDAFEGLLWIKTKNDHKFDLQLEVRFSLLRPAHVYVVHDSRVPAPTWLSSNFTRTEGAVQVSDAGVVDFRIWQSMRKYQRGETVVLGCNGSAGGAASMYVVLVGPESEARDLHPRLSRSGNDLVLSWDALPDAHGYCIYRGSEPYFEPDSPVAVLNGVEYVDGGSLSDSTLSRYYVIEALMGDGREPLRSRVGAHGVRLTVGRTLVSVPLQTSGSDLKSVLGQALTGGTNALVADRIMKWNGAGYETAWLVSGTGTAYDGQWMNSSGSALSEMTLRRGEGFWVEVRPGHSPVVLQFFGEVPTDSAWAIVVHPGLNLVGNCYPVSMAPAATGLWEQGVATGASNSCEADRIMAWMGDHYEIAWLVDGTGTAYDGTWLNATGSAPSPLRFEPGKGCWLHIRNGQQPRTWRYPNPFPGR